MSAAFAAHLLRREGTPPGLTTWNGSCPAQRFAVYRNNVAVSLRAALSAKYPGVEKLVGEAYFAALAGAFLRARPPTTPRLALYGEDFADFIEAFPPLAPWPYLADVARLEAAQLQAVHAADADALGPADFAAVADLTALRLVLHPSLRVLASRFAVADIADALEAGGDCAGLDPDRAQCVVIVRPRFAVRRLLAPPGMAAFLAALGAGDALIEAAESAARAAPGFDAGRAFQLIVANGLATRLATAEDAP